MIESSDEARRTAEAWRIVHNHAPAWWNHYARQFPDSKASWQSKRDDCAHYCVIEALKIRDAELDAARAEIARLKAREAINSALASPQPDAGARGEGARMHQHPTKDRPELTALIEKAKRAYKAMSPEEKEAHDKAQRESWVRGEMELAQLERETAVVAPSPSPEAAPTSEDAMKKALPALNAEAIKLADAAFEGWRLNYPNDENVQYAWGSIYFHSFPTPWRDLRTHVVQSIFTAGQRAFRAALHDILAEVAAQEKE